MFRIYPFIILEKNGVFKGQKDQVLLIFLTPRPLFWRSFFCLKGEKMKPRIAVHLHVYYTDMWNEIRQYLDNLNKFEYRLFVTIVTEDAALKKQIKQFHSDTVFMTVENRGYDVGPFIHFLHQIDLNAYDLIFKIHTKNNKIGVKTLLNHRYVSRFDWFRLLIGALLGSEKLVKTNIAAFQSNVALGMIGSKYLIASDSACSKEIQGKIREIFEKTNGTVLSKIKFVAGTMFIVRAKAMQIAKNNFSLSDFEPTDGSVKDGSLAHVVERCFGCWVVAQGYKIKGFDADKCFEWASFASALGRFAFQTKITHTNKKLVKVCKIPVWHRRFK